MGRFARGFGCGRRALVLGVLLLAAPIAGAHEVSIHQRLTWGAADHAKYFQEFLQRWGLRDRPLFTGDHIHRRLRAAFPGPDAQTEDPLVAANADFYYMAPATPVNLIRAGAILEDRGGRFCNHFYQPGPGPGEGRGLDFTRAPQPLPERFSWALGVGCSSKSLDGERISNARDAVTWMLRPYDPQNADDDRNDNGLEAAYANFREGLTRPTVAERSDRLAQAFLDLGHVLHLIEDQTSPAHTRNDSHSGRAYLLDGASRFEEWGDSPLARKLADDIRLQLEEVAKIEPPADALRAMALYTSTHYYSEDTFELSPTIPYAVDGEYLVSIGSATTPPGRHLGYLGPADRCLACEEEEARIAALGLSADGRAPCDSPPPGARPAACAVIQDPKDLVVRDMALDLYPRAMVAAASALNHFFRGHLDIIACELRRGQGDAVSCELKLANRSYAAGPNHAAVASTGALSTLPTCWRVLIESEAGTLVALAIESVTLESGAGNIMRLVAHGRLPVDDAAEPLASMMAGLTLGPLVRAVYDGPLDGARMVTGVRGRADSPAVFMVTGGLEGDQQMFALRECGDDEALGAVRLLAAGGEGECAGAAHLEANQTFTKVVTGSADAQGLACQTTTRISVEVSGTATATRTEGRLTARLRGSRQETSRQVGNAPGTGSPATDAADPPRTLNAEIARGACLVLRPGDEVEIDVSYAGSRLSAGDGGRAGDAAANPAGPASPPAQRSRGYGTTGGSGRGYGGAPTAATSDAAPPPPSPCGGTSTPTTTWAGEHKGFAAAIVPFTGGYLDAHFGDGRDENDDPLAPGACQRTPCVIRYEDVAPFFHQSAHAMADRIAKSLIADLSQLTPEMLKPIADDLNRAIAQLPPGATLEFPDEPNTEPEPFTEVEMPLLILVGASASLTVGPPGEGGVNLDFSARIQKRHRVDAMAVTR